MRNKTRKFVRRVSLSSSEVEFYGEHMPCSLARTTPSFAKSRINFANFVFVTKAEFAMCATRVLPPTTIQLPRKLGKGMLPTPSIHIQSQATARSDADNENKLSGPKWRERGEIEEGMRSKSERKEDKLYSLHCLGMFRLERHQPIDAEPYQIKLKHT